MSKRRQGGTRTAGAAGPPALAAGQVGDQLPALGDWDGPTYGVLGVLATDGERVECHACGRWFHSLGHHVRLAHRLSPDEYRALFGLKATTGLEATTGLASPVLREIRRKGAGHLTPYRAAGKAFLESLAPAQRSAYARGRKPRLETKLNQRTSRVWLAAQEGRRERLRALWRDPLFRARVGRRISQALGGRVLVACAVCGTRHYVKTSEARSVLEHACSKVCLRELRRRAARTRNPMRSPEARAKASATMRRRRQQPELAAKLDTANRRKGRRAAEQLMALPPGALDALSERDRTAVRLHYGLGGEAPHTYAEIGARLGITPWQAREALRRGVPRLLDSHAAANAPRRRATGRTRAPAGQTRQAESRSGA